jgi:AcrR family transcriptional regulator
MPGTKTRARARPRTRRSPEEARAHILAAATRLFAERGPDAVGLKEVAREAGVSHALVTHYFGTYHALVDEALATHVRRARAAFFERFAQSPDDDVGAWLEHLFQVTSDPLYARVAVWGSLSRRLDHEDLFPRREQGVRQIVDAFVQRYRARGVELDRENLERFLVVMLTSALGYAIVGPAIWGALGYDATAARTRAYREKMVGLAKRELEAEVRRAGRKGGVD